MLPTPQTGQLDYEKVYEPSEDTFLLLDCFENEAGFLTKKLANTGPIITEIGAGSGMVTSFIISNILNNSLVISTDINPHACKACLETSKLNNNQSFMMLDCCQMDLTGALIPNCIDLLIFNPPYVPAEQVPEIPIELNDPQWLDLALLGGPTGMSVTWKLLDQLHLILSANGIAYILFCARNDPLKVKQVMELRGWNVTEIIQRKAGWEVLSVLRFMKI